MSVLSSDTSLLSFAAELLSTADSCAKSSNGETVVETLIILSRHGSSVVREGAVYGLTGHLGVDGVRQRLYQMQACDGSDGVRDAAKDTLDDMGTLRRLSGNNVGEGQSASESALTGFICQSCGLSCRSVPDQDFRYCFRCRSIMAYRRRAAAGSLLRDGSPRSLPNTDVLLEIVGYGSEGTGSRYLRRKLYFPFRPLEGDEVYFNGDAMTPATVKMVDWFIYTDKSSLQVRLESLGLNDNDIESLISSGWVEHDDPTSEAKVGLRSDDKGLKLPSKDGACE
jgi:hypothetical protein